jgi:branched-chain amino acid transport system permease protein
MELAQTFINGILLGGLYGLIGLGLSINFGIMRVVHLAHGDFVVLGAYFLVVGLVPAGIPPLLGAVMVVPVLFAVGLVVQRLLIQRTLGRGVLPPLIVTFGLSMILENALLLVVSADARTLRSPLAHAGIPIGELTIPVVRLVDFGVGLACLAALLLLLGKSALGRALRATSDDPDTARAMGIDPRKMYAVAAGMAAALGGIAGVLLAATDTFYPTTGQNLLLIAFEVVVVGGLGSLTGTFVGGILLAVAQLLGAKWLGPSYGVITAHLVFLLVLLFRPQGLMPRTAE